MVASLKTLDSCARTRPQDIWLYSSNDVVDVVVLCWRRFQCSTEICTKCGWPTAYCDNYRQHPSSTDQHSRWAASVSTAVSSHLLMPLSRLIIFHFRCFILTAVSWHFRCRLCVVYINFIVEGNIYITQRKKNLNLEPFGLLTLVFLIMAWIFTVPTPTDQLHSLNNSR